MDEYITVQNAIKTTWMILEGLGFRECENGELAQSVEDVFATAPTEEARLVVTCSKCKYNKRCMVQFFVEDERLLPFNADTWFCADGVREEEESIKADGVKTHREPYDLLYEEGGANTT